MNKTTIGGNKRKLANALAMIGLIIIFIAYMFPFLMVVINSLKEKRDIIKSPFSWLFTIKGLSFDNFVNAFTQMDFLNAFKNSLIVTVSATVLVTILAAMLAYYIVRHKNMVSKLTFALMVASMIIPFQAIMIPLVSIYGGTLNILNHRDSRLEDDLLVEEFYDKIIESYDYPENYYIILIHAVYDVPGKSSDGLEMFDASDTVYEHLMCSICPVNLSKASLSYNAQTNNIEDRIRDWIVEMPVKGFLFPAFTDRASDVHQILYYTKKPEELQPAFIEHVLGSQIPLTAGDQKTSFQAIVSDTLGSSCDYETVRNIHDNLNEMLEEAKEAPEPLELSRPDIKRLLEKSGASEEQMETFDREFSDVMGEQTSVLASNIASTRTFQIETPDVIVKVNPDRSDLVDTREIDGRRCLVIAIDDHLEVNGIEIHP